MKDGKDPGAARMAYGACAGAVLAAVIGFGFSSILASLGLALITPSTAAGRSLAEFLARSALNFEGIHHVRIIGSSASGSAVSIMWPVTLWSVVPALALILGGYVAGRLSGLRDFRRVCAGIAVAFPYLVIMLVLRHWSSVHSAGVQLPRIPVEGIEFDPSMLPVMLKPAVGSLIFNVMLFATVFAGLGAGGRFRRPWVRGAISGVLYVYLIPLLILLLLTIIWIPRYNSRHTDKQIPTRSVVTLLPAIAGWTDYLVHGVTLKASATASEGVVADYSVGIISGMRDGDKRLPARWPAYLVLLIPGAVLFLAGRVAARGEVTLIARLGSAARMAALYALLMTAFSLFFTLTIRTALSGFGPELMQGRTFLGPSAAQTFPLALLIALVFGVVGALTVRAKDAHS